MMLNLIFMKITLKDIKVSEKINMFLDEYGNISEHFNLLNNLSYLDKNIVISIIVQSLNQLNCSKDTILNNFINYLYLGSFNSTDMSIFSDFFDLENEDIKHLSINKLIFKREYYDTCILDKVNNIE